MHDDELVERIAKALAARVSSPWERLDRSNRDEYRSQAAVAVEAIGDYVEDAVSNAVNDARFDASLGE